jgi:hypothetical protein
MPAQNHLNPVNQNCLQKQERWQERQNKEVTTQA